MQILQVEDDSEAAKAIELMLQSDGHSCETTTYGEDAVRLAQKNTYDVILLDVMLPDIDGYDVIELLREAEVRTPVLILTGLVEKNDAGASLGASHCLIKPIKRDELRNGIEVAMEQGRKEQASRRPDVRDDGFEERRSAARTKTLKSGQIVYNNGHCVIDCLVLCLSEAGAALQPTQSSSADILKYPENFQLRFENEPSCNCEVCWQHGNKLGVRFVGE